LIVLFPHITDTQKFSKIFSASDTAVKKKHSRMITMITYPCIVTGKFIMFRASSRLICRGFTTSNVSPRKTLPLTKIVATIGPASENLPVLPEIVRKRCAYYT
jgi:hypothetical protein